MPKAKKVEVAETYDGQSPYDRVITIWAQWNRLKDQQQPIGDSNLQDTKDFMRLGEAVEAMINDLPRYQWWAIRKSRGICTVWRFPNILIEEALQKAEEILTPKMQRHIATRRFFN